MIFWWETLRQKRARVKSPRVRVWLFAKQLIVKANAEVLAVVLLTPNTMQDGIVERDKKSYKIT